MNLTDRHRDPGGTRFRLYPQPPIINPDRPPEVVYVSGQVSKPGAVPYSEGLTISQAIILAGGSKSTARLRKVYIKRGDQQIKVNLKRVLQGRDDDVVLQPDDTDAGEGAFDGCGSGRRHWDSP